MDSKKLLENIEQTKQILLSTTLLSNNISSVWITEAKKLVYFICKAYDINEDINDYCELIVDEVSNLSLINEYKGLRSIKKYNEEYTDLDLLYDLKGKELVQISLIDRFLVQKGSSLAGEFEYNAYQAYNPIERTKVITDASSCGSTLLTCQAGLLYATGIGTSKDLEFALLRFRQCAFWGYIPALKYASYIYKLMGNKQMSDIYNETYLLCSDYLHDGITIIPDRDQNKYCEDAKLYFNLITSIYNDIIVPKSLTTIDFSFLEVIFQNSLTFEEKMKFINNYDYKDWQKITIDAKRPKKVRFGFDVY